MVLLELPVVVALVIWARWLGGKYGVPSWVRRIGWAIAALWAVTLVVSVIGLIGGFGSVVTGESVDPAQKARVLAEAISEAMMAAVLEMGVVVAGSALLLVLTWRYHWSAKPVSVPRDPPYR